MRAQYLARCKPSLRYKIQYYFFELSYGLVQSISFPPYGRCSLLIECVHTAVNIFLQSRLILVSLVSIISVSP